MSQRIYLDSNVYLDYFGDRKDNMRPLGEFAFKVFQRTLECEFIVVLSDWVLEELENKSYSKIQLETLLSELKKAGKLISTKRTEEDIRKAKRFTNQEDALHSIIAARNNCIYLVTRNLEDFLEFSDLIKPILPENI